MNAKRRKTSFRPALETNELERRVVLSVTAGSVVAARALQAQRRAALVEAQTQRRNARLERQAELRVNRQITRAFNQFNQGYNISQRQYLRNVRLGNPNALTALQAARTNGLNTLAGRLGTVYSQLPQGTGTGAMPTLNPIIGSLVTGLNTGANLTTGPNGYPGLTTTTGSGTIGSITPGTPLSLLLSLGALDTQNLTGPNLLAASRGTINNFRQATLNTVGNYIAANPLLGGTVSTGFNNPTGLGTTTGLNTGAFGGTTTTGISGIGTSTGFNNPTGLVNNITGYAGPTTNLYGTTGLNLGTVGLGTSTAANGLPLNGSTIYPVTSNINAGVSNPFLGSTGLFTLGGVPYQTAVLNPGVLVGTGGLVPTATGSLNGFAGTVPGTTTTNTGTFVSTTPGSGANNNNYLNNFYQGTGISPGIDNGFNNGLTYGFNTGLGLGFMNGGTAALSPGFSGGLAIR